MAVATTQVTAKLTTILNQLPDLYGHCSVQLCGYGSQVPRVNGVALVSAAEALNLEPDSTGQIQVTLYSNDTIAPAGTFYAFTFSNDNGDIIQVNAYRFVGFGSVDLSLIGPYDPNQPPPPLPPLITNLLAVLPASNAMVFDGSIYTTFQTTLPGDVTMPTIQNMVAGNLYTFIIIQDATGHHVFTWPPHCINATFVDPAPNSTTIQTFVCDEVMNLYAISAGTYWP